MTPTPIIHSLPCPAGTMAFLTKTVLKGLRIGLGLVFGDSGEGSLVGSALGWDVIRKQDDSRIGTYYIFKLLV